MTLRRFTHAEGAAGHCQLGNLPLATAELTAWLQEIFPAADDAVGVNLAAIPAATA
ncbi:MAG: hypothetical protein H0U69_05285 [Trueperaceae bacterium]|nr:hypothetical protein [Trueperaceae bacterium]